VSYLKIGNLLMASLLSAVALSATSIKWFGHSAFQITLPTGEVILVDPWITNPANKTGEADLAALKKVDLILITHSHGDHIGDAIQIAEKTKAKLIATNDVKAAIRTFSKYPKDSLGADVGHFGGEIAVLGGAAKIAFIPARHGSAFTMGEDSPNPKTMVPGGDASGFLITVKNGPAIYHTGDTDVFSDMSLVNMFHQVDVMLLCIGDRFTMGPKRAALAAKLVQPTKFLIPMHFGTFSALTGTPEEFQKALTSQKVKTPMKALHVGEILTL
jgi:L-ascorbate metabolism protein UlaG (beta-lactamase superfamily)